MTADRDHLAALAAFYDRDDDEGEAAVSDAERICGCGHLSSAHDRASGCFQVVRIGRGAWVCGCRRRLM